MSGIPIPPDYVAVPELTVNVPLERMERVWRRVDEKGETVGTLTLVFAFNFPRLDVKVRVRGDIPQGDVDAIVRSYQQLLVGLGGRFTELAKTPLDRGGEEN